MVGETAKQACPGGASGLARWKCVENHRNNNLPRVMWFPESPDLSDCKSAWLLSLQVYFCTPSSSRVVLLMNGGLSSSCAHEQITTRTFSIVSLSFLLHQ